MKANSHKRFAALWLVALAFALMSLWWYQRSAPLIAQPTFTSGSTTQIVAFPYKVDSEAGVRDFQISIHVTYAPYQSSRFRIVPDDCLVALHVNEKVVDLRGIGGLCDFSSGFSMDLGAHLIEGENEVRLFLSDKMGKRGLDLRSERTGAGLWALKVSLGLWLFLSGWFVMRQAGFERGVAALFALGMVLRLLYMIETPWNERSYDVDGHIDYIAAIASTGFLPEAASCWTCYHPPLYYMVAALWYKLGLLIDKESAYVMLQLFSLLLSSAFLIYALLILKTLIRHPAALFSASALLIFTPSMVIHSVRIGNDVMLYLTYAAALYYYLRWLEKGRGLLLSTLFAAASLFVKSNGIVIMGVLGVAYLLRLHLLGRWREGIKSAVLVAGAYLLSIALAFGLHHWRVEGAMVGNATSLHSGLKVPNELHHYLYFDLKTALAEPFANPWQNGKGRDYFLNYWLQTSLFGEFSLGESWRPLGSVMVALTLLLGVFALLALWRMERPTLIGAMPLLLSALLLLLSAMALRAAIPYACSNDFRYSLLFLISWVFMVAQAQIGFERQERVVGLWLLQGSTWLFTLLGSVAVLSFR